MRFEENLPPLRLLLSSCSPQEMEEQLANYVVNNSILNEPTINELLADERFVQQVFGSLFTAKTNEQH